MLILLAKDKILSRAPGSRCQSSFRSSIAEQRYFRTDSVAVLSQGPEPKSRTLDPIGTCRRTVAAILAQAYFVCSIYPGKGNASCTLWMALLILFITRGRFPACCLSWDRIARLPRRSRSY